MSVRSISPKFPVLPSDEEVVTYEAIMAPAFKEFKEKYEHYLGKESTIIPLTKDWTARCLEIKEKKPSKEELNKEFEIKVDTYIALRIIRNDLVEIQKIYDQAIKSCQQSLLDVQTLLTLQKHKIKMGPIRDSYNKTVNDLDLLVEQRDKIAKLYASFKPNLRALRLSGEPMAVICSDFQGYLAVPSFVNGVVGRTSYFNVAVEARIKELELLKKVEKPPHPSKPAPHVPQQPVEKKG